MNQVLHNSKTGKSLQRITYPILEDLQRVESLFNRTLHSDKPGVAPLLKHLENYRGKRLRPTLLLLAAQACGEVTRNHHILAAVVEMIHTATLVHDDVLDSAGTRRHVQTVNSLWGNQASILLGDYLFTHAFHLTSTTGDARACEIIGRATNQVCEGELHQIMQRGNLQLTEEEYFQIIEGKTAALTQVCCQLGAMYAGSDDTTIDCLSRYGNYLGIAFQIADDLLDIVGEEDETGKSLGTDIEQKKLTLPLIYALQQSTEHDAMVHVLSNGHRDKRKALLPYLEKAKALSYAKDKADEFASMAQNELACLPPSECKEILMDLADIAVHRNT